MGEAKALIAIVMFIWHSLTAYVGTPEGAAELAAIEADLFGDEGQTTSATTDASGQTGSSVRRG